MDTIYVYADFDFLEQTEEIGVLSYEQVRGNDHFAFEFSREWLSRHGGLILSGDVMNVRGTQHPMQGNSVFGFVKDSFPDRWGRILLDRRERLAAKQAQRPVRNLSNYDYLMGIEDTTRMGGIRYSTEKNGPFINSNFRYCVPPFENLRALCNACQELESAEERNELPEQRWLDQLVDPGSSLGGARPKANVMDTDGRLYVAKFPSKKDLEDTELIEHFSHTLARKAGINVAKTHVIPISKGRHLLLSERFDRAPEGKRRHFASAMSLLGLDDGSGAGTGNGYLDIVDFIVRNCTDVQLNLHEIYRRAAFNVIFGNTDDHFRNHGFILTPKGWTLSPAYDINPSTKTHQCLLINDTTELSDINALRNSCESYMLDRKDASDIINEVTKAISDWQKVAEEIQISVKMLEHYNDRWTKCIEKTS
jgi:serine/threonine-protein kinase HipA